MGVTFGSDEVATGGEVGSPRTGVVVDAERGASEFLAAVTQLNEEKQVIVQLLGTYLGKLDKRFDLRALGAGDDQLIGILTAMGEKIEGATANLRRLNKEKKAGLAREEESARRLAALAEEKAAVDAEIEKSLAELERVRAAQAEKEEALGTVSGEARELAEQLDTVRRDAAAAAEVAAERIEALQAELETAERTSAEGIAALEETLRTERKAAEEAQAAAERAITERQAAVDEARARADTLVREIEALRAENEKLEARSKTTGERSAKLAALRLAQATLEADADESGSDDEFGGSPARNGALDHSGFSDADRSRDEAEFGDDDAEEFVGPTTLDEASLARVTKIEGLRHEQGELESGYSRLEEARAERVAHFEETAAAFAAVRAEAERAVKAVSELEAALEAAKNKIDTPAGTENRKNIVAEGRAAKAKIEPELTAAREAHARLDAELGELSRAVEGLREEIGQIDSDMTRISEKFRANQEELEALEKEAAAKDGGDA